ncbi:mannose-6-phosphate isomerase [Tribolium castaneum]|uniref:Mannose-6-phosphate isomerase n=1 Tax=Tribolium castaneum TaxID=7070 RepID=D1ZZV1_TRICA|nr:PREDICTED: mannose-6-phosphate isomerase [Tribolium castaneum]EFA01794.1 Mannose-6-phosphate isomerase-like Protein [Tribolium castaneum]|eukprot:XP_975088.1 PREDICTED: mannose-6-phosphate isomerase [Tribolium castaneum]
MELNYKIQTYAWGKKGRGSKVANLHSNVNKNFKIDDNSPYAELWLGTHVNGPSSLKNGEPLANLIAKRPDYLGANVRKVFGDQLPFLFKVLSVNQALSVQAHPSKKHAEELHKQHPDIYKDPNHKPEMAIALTPFEALCGFRPLPEIAFFLKNIPELKTATGDVADKHKHDSDLLKDAFKTIFLTEKNTISEQLKKLIHRLKTLDEKEREKLQASLIERLYAQYPGDVGCFMVYFLNYLKLKPGEAIFLGPNLPHAYIQGDCIECMACSDNVVRAGLTPKLIDFKTLCDMVIYEGEKPEKKLFKPEIGDSCTLIFKPPVPDFAVIQIKVPANMKNHVIKKTTSASILIVIEGKARSNDTDLVPGSALFLPADQELKIENITEDLLIYQALANV